VITGASSQLGAPLLAQLSARVFLLTAWSRHAADQPASSSILWQQVDLQPPPAIAASTRLLIHLAPIHLLPALLTNTKLSALRVIAISTCSVRFKAQSHCRYEQQVVRLAAEHGHQLTVLRPSMLYGAGRDGTVAVLQTFIRRFGFLVLPAQAAGLRQPVHVGDVVQAIMACIDQPSTVGQCYELGGAERLSLDQLAERIFMHNKRRARIITVPQGLLHALIAIVRWTRLRADWRPGLVARAQQAQVVDNGPAMQDFAYAPRPFDGRFVVGADNGSD
jgi:nucleoside-diphosphate-sugar epimerase